LQEAWNAALSLVLELLPLLLPTAAEAAAEAGASDGPGPGLRTTGGAKGVGRCGVAAAAAVAAASAAWYKCLRGCANGLMDRAEDGTRAFSAALVGVGSCWPAPDMAALLPSPAPCGISRGTDADGSGVAAVADAVGAADSGVGTAVTGVAAGAAVATGVFVETSADFAGALTAEEPEGAGAVETSRVFAVLGSCVGSEGAAAGAGVGGGGGPGLNATLAMSDAVPFATASACFRSDAVFGTPGRTDCFFLALAAASLDASVTMSSARGHTARWPVCQV